MEEGRVQWAQSGEANIAFRVLGSGPVDLVFLSGITSHIEVLLEEPGLRRWWERLGTIARVILVDRRGLGLSDRIHGPLALADEVADIDAVLDAAGCDRVVVQAYAAGGPLAIEYAARRPRSRSSCTPRSSPPSATRRCRGPTRPRSAACGSRGCWRGGGPARRSRRWRPRWPATRGCGSGWASSSASRSRPPASSASPTTSRASTCARTWPRCAS